MLTFSALLFALTLGAAQQPAADPPATAATQAARGTAQITLPVSLSKIQEAIARPPAIKTETDRRVFRVEVIARKLSIDDILGPDYLRGPVAQGGMTHQEFLNMVTPTEYRGYSMFSNKEGMVIAATSLALQWAVMKAVDRLKDARTERAKDAARREVLDALNELEKARAKAGQAAK